MNRIRPFVNVTYDEPKRKSFDFSLLSYNVLAQELLEKNDFLYDWSDESVLKWEYRSRILLNEIRQFNADIMCFQEIQESHLDWFSEHLSDLGYDGVYKKRTRNNLDGCAIYYKKDKFILKENVTVEYYQPGVNILDRDNVGIILRLSLQKNEKENIIISTTHILYNKQRHDIKLAQVHLLLTEIERVSYKGHREMDNHIVPIYHPIILTGDFNLEPITAVYDFIINGALYYSNLLRPNLRSQNNQSAREPTMGNELIPKNLGITENSEHANVLELRKLNNFERQINDSLYVQLHHSEKKKDQQLTLPHCTFKFGSGNIYHNLNFSSVYSDTSCSTYHEYWTIVDYIFYTSSNLKLKTYMKLPTSAECQNILAMPNKVTPSDHLPLFAVFSYPIH